MARKQYISSPTNPWDKITNAASDAWDVISTPAQTTATPWNIYGTNNTPAATQGFQPVGNNIPVTPPGVATPTTNNISPAITQSNNVMQSPVQSVATSTPFQFDSIGQAPLASMGQSTAQMSPNITSGNQAFSPVAGYTATPALDMTNTTTSSGLLDSLGNSNLNPSNWTMEGIGDVMGAATSAFQTYTGWQQLELGQDKFAFQKDAWEQDFALRKEDYEYNKARQEGKDAALAGV